MDDGLKAVAFWAALIFIGAPLGASIVAVFAYAILGPWVWLYLQVFG